MAPQPAVVQAFVDALSTYDAAALRSLCSPTVRHWVSVSEREQGLDGLLSVLETERDVVKDASFDVDVVGQESVVIRMTVDGTTHLGATFHIPVCLVVTYEGDKVAHIAEYANLERAQDLVAELLSKPAAP